MATVRKLKSETQVVDFIFFAVSQLARIVSLERGIMQLQTALRESVAWSFEVTFPRVMQNPPAAIRAIYSCFDCLARL